MYQHRTHDLSVISNENSFESYDTAPFSSAARNSRYTSPTERLSSRLTDTRTPILRRSGIATQESVFPEIKGEDRPVAKVSNSLPISRRGGLDRLPNSISDDNLGFHKETPSSSRSTTPEERFRPELSLHELRNVCIYSPISLTFVWL